ncbi:MAG: hypothetical protein U9N63_14715, partial [Pseudomonadota bacterium]|nr:hypothetical protein [Pseudomonadota bacterium]
FYQIKLFEADGSVEFHYGGWAASSDDSATIGMENYFASGGDCGPNCGNLNNERPPNNYRFVPCYNIWSGNISTAWNNVNNWEPNRLPTDTINTIIPYRINNPLVGSPGATCSNLNVLSGAVFNTGSNTITTADILNYGTINAGSSHWYTKGDYHGGGTFNAGTSEVDFIGVYYAYIWGSPIFYDLDINKTNGTKTVLLSDVNVSRWVFTHSGDLDINGHTLTSNLCDIYGDNLINNTGTFILTGNGPYFHDGSNYICSAGVIDSVDNIEFQIGSTETISGGTIYLEGDFTAYDGNFTPTGGAVVFDGSGSSYINGSPDFFDMSVAKDSDSTTYGHSDFTVTNSLNLVSGRFDPNDYTVTIGK